MRCHHGHGSQRPSPGDWSQAEIEALESLCLAGETWEAIAAAVGHTVRACQLKAKFQGVRRDGKEAVGRQLVDDTDEADTILAARLAKSRETFADHDLRMRPLRPVYAGTAHLTGWATVQREQLD